MIAPQLFVVVDLPLTFAGLEVGETLAASASRFAFAVTPELLVRGVVFALAIGFVAGLLPALRAARMPVAQALREP